MVANTVVGVVLAPLSVHQTQPQSASDRVRILVPPSLDMRLGIEATGQTDAGDRMRRIGEGSWSRAFESASVGHTDMQDPLSTLRIGLENCLGPWSSHVTQITKAVERLLTEPASQPNGGVDRLQQLRALVVKSCTTILELTFLISTVATVCKSESHPLGRSAENPIHGVLYQISQRFDSLKVSLERHLPTIQHQIDNTVLETQVTLQNLQLEESRKAIQQADTIKRLTILAFIYIPIQTAAGIFSFHVREFDTKPSVWGWALLVVVLLVATISAAVWHRVTNLLRRLEPSFIRQRHPTQVDFD